MDVDYYSVRGSNHLKNFLEYLFPAKSTLFIAVSHTRDTDHGVGSNFIPTVVLIPTEYLNI